MSTKNAATQKSNHRRKKSITDVLFRTKITACNNIFYSNGKKYKKNLHNKNKRYKFANEILLPTKGTLSPLFCIENKMISEQRIIKIFEDNPEIFGEYFLVEVKVSGDNDISIRIDKDNGLSIDECGQISHQIDTLLNREEEDFNLEVSSPGLTEPFKVTKQYIKNIGHQVEVLTTAGDKMEFPVSTSYTTSHKRTVTGLQANTTYYYELTCVDKSGNKTSSSSFSSVLTFTTSAAPVTPTVTTTEENEEEEPTEASDSFFQNVKLTNQGGLKGRITFNTKTSPVANKLYWHLYSSRNDARNQTNQMGEEDINVRANCTYDEQIYNSRIEDGKTYYVRLHAAMDGGGKWSTIYPVKITQK